MPDTGGFEQSLEQSESDEKDEQIEKLEEYLTKEQDSRKEERFIALLSLVILLDIFFFTLMPSLGGPIAILVLQLLLFVPVARMMGVNEIGRLLDKVLFRVLSKKEDNGP